jgi:hypothetical protein
MDGISKGEFSLRSVTAPILVLLFLFFAFGSVAHAQSTASLNGTVTDSTGATVPSAKVVAKNMATNVDNTTTADGAGAYLFPSLPIGPYRLEVSAPGFRMAVVEMRHLADLELHILGHDRGDLKAAGTLSIWAC